MHKHTAIRGFSVHFRDLGPGARMGRKTPRRRSSDPFADILVGWYLPNGAAEAEFSLEFHCGSVAASGVDMRLCAYDDAMAFMASCTDLLTALAPLRDRCTVERVRQVLLGLGFVEYSA